MKSRQAIPRFALPTLATAAIAVASCIVLLLAGCASSAGIAPVAQPLTAAAVGLDSASATTGTPAVATDWWRSLDDPRLSALIERALAGSPTLRIAQARLARADAAVSGARANEGLQASASVDVSRQRFTATSIYPPPLGGSVQTMATAQVDASWEFDFFGRQRAAIEAAVGAQRAAQADVQAARLLLASQVARTYVQIGRLVEQRSIAERALQQRTDLLRLIEQRVRAGLDTNVERRQGEGALPETRQQIEQIDEQIVLARHALAALTAQAPGALDGLSVDMSRLHALPLPASVPADLLGRRADVSAARWRVEAADHEMQSAKAQFYPNLDLSAFAGLSSIGLGQLLHSASEQYGIGPALNLPYFEAAHLRANLRQRSADFDAAVEAYNATVLDAARDAADQVASLRSIDVQQREQSRAQAAAESAWALSTERYQAGLGTYLVVLNSETSVLAQRRLAVDLKARVLDTQIALARALGGGYSAATP